MKSLLIGNGQEFALVKDAFAKTKNKIRIISENVSEYQIFRNKYGKEINLDCLLNGNFLTRSDLSKIDSIFISIYDRDLLSPILKAFWKLNLKQPIFVISTAINDQSKEKFPTFNFVPIQDLFSKQIQNIISKCEFLFRLQVLKTLVRPKEKVLIIIFENPDPDSIASAMALKTLFTKIKVSSTIAYTGVINRLQNRVLIQELGNKFFSISDLDLNHFDKFALVDAQPYFFKEQFDFDIVIDHHPKRDRVKAPFSDIRTKLGATSTIMTEYLINSGAHVGKRLATALLYGIKTDTGNFERHLTDDDIRSFRYLYSKADRNLLRRIELSEIPKEALPHFQYALKHKKTIRDMLYVNLGRIKIPEVHVMVADFLLRLDKISQVIVSAIFDHNLIIIFRNDGYKKDAGKLASLAFGSMGNAGGHKFMARAEIPYSVIAKLCKASDKNAVDKFILDRVKKYINKV